MDAESKCKRKRKQSESLGYSSTASSSSEKNGKNDDIKSVSLFYASEDSLNSPSPPMKKRKYLRSIIKSTILLRKNGEKTPYTNEQPECFRNTFKLGNEEINMNSLTPQSLRARKIPLPLLSWTDSVELMLLLGYKEQIRMNDNDFRVYRDSSCVNGRMRAILLDWIMEVCEVYKLRRVTYYLAVDFVDRFIMKVKSIAKNHLQLLGITCLFIAAKLEEIYPPKLAEFAYVTDGACSDVEMLKKEMSVLKTIKWDMNTFTISNWLSLYLQLASNKSTNFRDSLVVKIIDNDVIYPQYSPYVFMIASMLVDLCSLDDGMLLFKYSVVAAAAIYYVLNREKALYVSGYRWRNIKACVDWMDPFAVVVARTINSKPLIIPHDPSRKSSALRISNSSIILDEGHCIQNHVVNLTILEQVYDEIKTRKRNRDKKEAYYAEDYSNYENKGKGKCDIDKILNTAGDSPIFESEIERFSSDQEDVDSSSESVSDKDELESNVTSTDESPDSESEKTRDIKIAKLLHNQNP